MPKPYLRTTIVLLVSFAALHRTPTLVAQEIQIFKGEQPNDSRLQDLKDLNGYFPMEVPESKAQWQQRASELRQRVLVATGLWPMPKKTPLNAVVHGKVQRDGFTVEKVYFESVPNHFVTGLLFRPDDGKTGVKRPAVLSPHGHGGRLQDHGVKRMKDLIAKGEETFEDSGRFPKVARCAQLARMGCVTFIFDMLGYADSQQISRELAHRYAKRRPEFENSESWGLFSAQAELRLQSVMSIQTWNSIRCLDFLESLPDVDSKRLAVTGGSGGGTQTILLCAIDERPITAFPNGMVSTSMQGGCTCENCCLLRIGTGNVELAALFAPKPQAMTAADDWTREMMTRGYPELQEIYALTGSKSDVFCRPMLHFPHNYNYVTRATMYSWFNKHMQLGLEEPIIEKDFPHLTEQEHSVWNSEHAQPPGGEAYERSLTKYLAATSDQQIQSMPTSEFTTVAKSALETLVGRSMPSHENISRSKVKKAAKNGYIYFEDIIRLESEAEELPVVSLYPTGTKWNGDVVLWLSERGNSGLYQEGHLHADVQRLLDGGASVVSADLFQQGEFLSGDQIISEQRVVKNPRESAAYTFCYNDTLFTQRVHDLLTLIAFADGYEQEKPARVNLIGVDGMGPVAAVARVIAGDTIDKCAIDTDGFRFKNITSYRDPNFLPGIVKYGDLPTILALNAPNPLHVGGEPSLPRVNDVYRDRDAANAVKFTQQSDTKTQAVTWILER